MNRYIFCIQGTKGERVLDFLLSSKIIDLNRLVIFSYDDTGTDESVYHKVMQLCSGNIPFYDYKENKKLLDQFSKDEESLLFAIGWQYMISGPAVEQGRLIVFHDSLLPKYRGFNPLVTALINGDTEIGVTALIANEGIDTGDIIGQKKVRIEYPIKIEQAIHVAASQYVLLVKEILSDLNRNRIIRRKQDDAESSFSLWRDEGDYYIDWSLNAQYISRFIDAVGFPYKGARTNIDDTVIIIHDSETLPDINIVNRIPGKLIRAGGYFADVVCGQGILRIYNVKDVSCNEYTFKHLRKRLK